MYALKAIPVFTFKSNLVSMMFVNVVSMNRRIVLNVVFMNRIVYLFVYWVCISVSYKIA